MRTVIVWWKVVLLVSVFLMFSRILSLSSFQGICLGNFFFFNSNYGFLLLEIVIMQGKSCPCGIAFWGGKSYALSHCFENFVKVFGYYGMLHSGKFRMKLPGALYLSKSILETSLAFSSLFLFGNLGWKEVDYKTKIQKCSLPLSAENNLKPRVPPWLYIWKGSGNSECKTVIHTH